MSWIAGTIAAGAKFGSDMLGLATRQSPTSSTHQAKLGLKYGKMYDEWSAKNMPAYNRAGMESAGFNPILAITNGQSAHGMPSISGTSAYDSFSPPDLGGAVSAYFNAQQQEQGLDYQKEQINNAKAQGKNIAALTGLYLAQRAKVIRDTLFPTNANSWYHAKELLKFMKKEGVLKEIGEAFAGKPNNFYVNNSNNSATKTYSTFREAVDSVKREDIKPRFPVMPVPLQEY